MARSLAGGPSGSLFFFFSWQPRKEGGLDLVIHFFPFVPFWVFLFGVRFRVDRDMDVHTYVVGVCMLGWRECGVLPVGRRPDI